VLLTVDVGNTQTALGLYAGDVLAENWRLATERSTTADELGVLLSGLLDFESVDGICLASTVPVLVREWQSLADKWANAPLLVVGPGVKTGVPIRYDDPREVGADRIVNAVAAFDRFGGPSVVVDFGTATTFDVVSAEATYEGGIIAPGLDIAAEALFSRAARLPRVDIRKPAHLIGTSTVGSMQSGIYYGYAGLVDGILTRMKRELTGLKRIVATGGYAALMAEVSQHIDEVDEELTLKGLKLVWDRNQKPRGRRR
jgi:type III pantothenate kinase